MQFAAVTQQTATWLLGQGAVLRNIHDALRDEKLAALRQTDFAAGPLRISALPDGTVLGVWNKEYLSGTGAEPWGLLRLDGPNGIWNDPTITYQVFERLIYLFSQRLQGFVIDKEFMHKALPNGVHSCLAGRGSDARQQSIGYFEGGPGLGDLEARAIIAAGPFKDRQILESTTLEAAKKLVKLVGATNKLIDGTLRRPILESPAFDQLRQVLTPASSNGDSLSTVTVTTTMVEHSSVLGPYETMHWSYEDWITKGALNEAQKRVLATDVVNQHPVRIMGPAGSGKTLLMQLLSMGYLRHSQSSGDKCKVLYVVHNAPMAQMVTDRLLALGGAEFLTSGAQSILVSTLAEYGRKQLDIDVGMVIDTDAQKTKAFQLEEIRRALREALNEKPKLFEQSALLSQIWNNDDLFSLFSVLVMREISSAIKGRGLVNDEKRYVESEISFSRLHRILNKEERKLIFDCFQRYQTVILEEYGLLDSDDVALSLYARMRTPVWQLRRKIQGFDLVLVDEAQLFNENEKRVFPLLTRGGTTHVPIALALDEAQEVYGFTAAGLGALGIPDIENQNLPANHRSTKEIVSLAFFIIQKTTDLFGADFPDFTQVETGMVPSTHQLAGPPQVITCNEEARSYARFLLKVVQKLRAQNVRQIAVVSHSEAYWEDFVAEFSKSGLPLHVLIQRGEKISPDEPLVILSRPAFVGGQEFDAVVIVGMEQGLVPPRISDNAPLAAALEQQLLRELYLTVSRSRYRVIFTLNRGSAPNAILAEAINQGLVREYAD